MTFQGPDPYGTPGGFPGPLTVGVIEDVRKADGKTYIAFLVVNSSIIERRRSEIDEIIRIIGEGGVPIVAIAITEGNLASGSVIDSAMTELRLGTQDFVPQQISPGIVLVTLERNIITSNVQIDSANATTTLINTDLTCLSTTIAIPGPATSLWTMSLAGFVLCNATGNSTISARIDLVHSGGTIAGSLLGDPVTPVGNDTTRMARLQSAGIVTGGQTITVNVLAQQDVAGTLTKKLAMLIAVLERTT